MSNQPSRRDPWRWPVLLLWGIFFLLGLWPEFSFYLFRSAGYVYSQNAIINSYNFITWCLVGYVAHVVYNRCLEAGLPPLEALGKAIQLGVVAFVAFVDMPIEQIPEIPNATDRALVVGMALIKLFAWIYLYALFIRYSWWRQPDVFVRSLSWMALGSSESLAQKHSSGAAEDKSSSPQPMKEQAD